MDIIRITDKTVILNNLPTPQFQKLKKVLIWND